MAEKTNEYVINADLFGAVGVLWAGNPSSISPFRYGKVQAPGTAEKQALAKAGICDASGQIAAAIRPALDVLGTANAFTRMYLSGGQPPAECIVYFAPGKIPVSLRNIGGEMQIGYPAASGAFMQMAAQAIGTSAYRSVPFDATLSHDEAVALAGMIDVQRKQALRSLADEQTPVVADIGLGALGKTTSQKGEKSQWLASVLLDIISQDRVPEDRLLPALESLVGKGFAVRNASSYRLGDEALSLAHRMLVFDSALVLTAGHLGPGESFSVAGFTCLEAGIHDLLVIDAGVDSVHLQSVSSAGVLDSIQAYLTDVHMHEKLDAPAAENAGQQTRKFCPQCGTAIQPGKKFCGSCGAKA